MGFRLAAIGFFVACFSAAFLGGCTCATGEGNQQDLDGSRARRPNAIPRDDAGNVVGFCGKPGQDCCDGNACDEGLECSATNQCCAIAGGPRLDQAEDCCPGWVWEDNDCWVPEGGTCTEPNQCKPHLVCLNNECVQAP